MTDIIFKIFGLYVIVLLTIFMTVFFYFLIRDYIDEMKK